MLAGVLDKAPRAVRDPRLLVGEWVDIQVAYSAIALALDQRRALRKGLLYVVDHRRFGRVVGTFRVPGRRLHTLGGIDKEIVSTRGVQKLFGNRPLGGVRFEVVFFLWKVFGHGDLLSANVVPAIQ